MKHIPRKRFGQHFLVDTACIEAIVRAVDPQAGQPLVEIGPGLGAITLPLRTQCQALTVIELDRDLAAHWRGQRGIQVVESDVLRVQFRQGTHHADGQAIDFSGIACGVSAHSLPHGAELVAQQPWRLVGNLPYNISSPILFHLLPWAHQVQDQHFMLQKEVIDRMVAQPSTAAYGRLSVMLQWRYAMDSLFDVPPSAFDPPPRVQSAVVRMLPRPQPVALNPDTLEALVKVAFSQRRKLLRHTLGRWLEEQKSPVPFDCQRRAEEVSVAEFTALAAAQQPAVAAH